MSWLDIYFSSFLYFPWKDFLPLSIKFYFMKKPKKKITYHWISLLIFQLYIKVSIFFNNFLVFFSKRAPIVTRVSCSMLSIVYIGLLKKLISIYRFVKKK